MVKFGIGSRTVNPLANDTHHAIRELPAGIYQKDLHFVMELVQNADDNHYEDGKVPELQFVLVDEDLGGYGVQYTLLVLNNEIGFSRANVESLCSIGRSTKKGRRQDGYIGEKGIGFKSVFLVTHHPIVISNGFRIGFSDSPTESTDLGYIVPEWVEHPTDVELSNCLGIAENQLPSTVIVLPIRQDKVEVIRSQLFELSPQLLRTKKSARSSDGSRHMSVHRHRRAPSKEIARMIPNDCSYSIIQLVLPATGEEVSFHVWQQTFSMVGDHEIEDRRNINMYKITLAFPLDRNNNTSDPSVFAFLPMKNQSTGFKFIINADFALVASRDSIRFDSICNENIFQNIPEAFMSAFICPLKTLDNQPEDVYRFAPDSSLNAASNQPWLAAVIDGILQRLKDSSIDSSIVICAENIGQEFSVLTDSDIHSRRYCPPLNARMVDPMFRSIIERAQEMNFRCPWLTENRNLYIVDAECQGKYESKLTDFGVRYFTSEEYAAFLSEKWLLSLPDELYVELLIFLSKEEDSKHLSNLPILKYFDEENTLKLLAPCDKKTISLYVPEKSTDMSFLSQWISHFASWVSVRFMPSNIMNIAESISEDDFRLLRKWLTEIAGVEDLSVGAYVTNLISLEKENVRLSLSIVHLILHALETGKFDVPVLLPASISKWPRYGLESSWHSRVLCLSESYFNLPFFLKGKVGHDLIVEFLTKAMGALDIFGIKEPPDAPLTLRSHLGLSGEELTSLIAWLQDVRYIPGNLKKSLRESEWVKTVEHGTRKPSACFIDLGRWKEWKGLLLPRDVPFVDTQFFCDLRPFESIVENLGMVTLLHSEVQNDTAKRWYAFLRSAMWMGWRNTTKPVIWIPNQSTSRTWRRIDECVIHDRKGLFHGTLCVLDLYYRNEEILSFFKDNVGVAETPNAGMHRLLWINWSKREIRITEEECQNIWSVIAEGWDFLKQKRSTEVKAFYSKCRIPCTSFSTGSEQIMLARPSEILLSDDLVLTEAFQKAFPSLKFAWYPRNADASAWADQLVQCYKDLGVKQISDIVSVESSKGLAIYFETGGIGRGVYRAILGYLTGTLCNVPYQTRKRMVRQLQNVKVYFTKDVDKVSYKLCVGGKVYSVDRNTNVRWEKTERTMYVTMRSFCNKARVAYELTSELAKGMVGGERAELVNGLRDWLLMSLAVHFEDDAVQDLLRAYNMRLTLEDEALLQEGHIPIFVTMY
ncbi:hypothetical protein KP509_32G014600 [Ceratopteris richardii]|uniref:Sacsin/Nov domain-containing protein n=1 Tax=Ceratopteris richardii TaxID=49495 RepID=A0A8T2QTC9_CERRI|nr:hypothetical protein KP509_32G014600 [Ceratopteris richardii]